MSKPQIILGIESSCDETAAAVVQKQGDRVIILSNVVASSAKLQEKFGGVIPEQAAREQIKSITPVIQEAIENCKLKIENLDAISVSYGPGLIGSLLVGVETAKTLAKVWDKPLIPINHLIGHFYSNWINSKYKVSSSMYSGKAQNPSIPQFPCIGLLISGGHTDLIYMTAHGKYQYLGGTRDDAAGECFDKCARLLGLPYPGGPSLAKLAKSGNPNAFNLPRPMINSKDFDFSFSGLKTAVANLLINEGGCLRTPRALDERSERIRVLQSRTQDACIGEQVSGVADRSTLPDLAASIEQAIVDVLVTKTIKAAKTYKVSQIIVAGGVAANQSLIRNLKFKIRNLKLKIQLNIPPAELCTDNAAMIAAAAFFNNKPIDPVKLQANPNLSL